MIEELEYTRNTLGFCEPLVNIEVQLPALTDYSGNIVTPSGKTLPGDQPSKYGNPRRFLPISNLYVGVRLINDEGDQVFNIVTRPDSNIWDISNALNNLPRPPLSNFPNIPPFVILPLIQP